MSQLGRNIRKHRERLGLNRSQFARKVGVSPTAVQNWEDEGASPRADIMMIISDVLGVDPVFLIDDGTMEEKPADPSEAAKPREVLADLKRKIADLLGVPSARVEILVRY
jgi:transcriptional regulator with XRE-family HTH domain